MGEGELSDTTGLAQIIGSVAVFCIPLGSFGFFIDAKFLLVMFYAGWVAITYAFLMEVDYIRLALEKGKQP